MLEELTSSAAFNGPQTILIGAVDNNRSRQMCHEVFQESRNIIYIVPVTENIRTDCMRNTKERSYYNKACCGNISGYFAR